MRQDSPYRREGRTRQWDFVPAMTNWGVTLFLSAPAPEELIQSMRHDSVTINLRTSSGAQWPSTPTVGQSFRK